MQYWKRWIGDYARDTGDLTLEEHGAYALLLDHYYATGGPLPDDTPRLLRLLRAVTDSERTAISNVLHRFFPVGNDGLRHNQRADSEIAEAAHRAEIASANAKKRWRGDAKAYAPAMPTHMPLHSDGNANPYASASSVASIFDASHSHSHSHSQQPKAIAAADEENGRGGGVAGLSFSHPDHQAAYLAARRTVRNQVAFDAAIRAEMDGMHGSVPESVMGRAILEMQAADAKFSARALRAFVKSLTEQASTPTPRRNGHAPTDRITAGRQALMRSLAADDDPFFDPATGTRTVPPNGL